MKRLLFMFLFLYLCNSVSLDLPAVSTENVGSLVNIDITIENGTGKIYFLIPPYNGISYQESFMNSLQFMDSQKINFSKENDFYIDFYAEHTSSVEGASGGVATSVILKSLLENKTINESIVVTGEITPIGNVLPVGGIPEKFFASYFNNKSMLLIPSSTLTSEKVIVKRLSKEFDFPVYEYSSFNDVYSVYTTNNLGNSGLKEISINGEENTNIILLNDVETNVYFNGIVYDMLKSYNRDLLFIHDNYPSLLPYFESVYNNSYTLYEKGYSYSAGNELFLGMETLSYLTFLYSEEGFQKPEIEINSCLENTKKNLDNFDGSLEYYIASEVRYVKAKDSMDVYFDEKNNSSSTIYLPSLLTRSKMWCDSAYVMSLSKKNSDFDKNSLTIFVENKLLKYIGNTSQSLETARKYYSEGYYGAALNEIISFESDFMECENLNLTYDWPKMMYFHSLYLNSSDKFGNNSFSDISKYACSYERNLLEYAPSKIIEQKEDYSEVCLVLILILFTLSIIYYIFIKFKLDVRW